MKKTTILRLAGTMAVATGLMTAGCQKESTTTSAEPAAPAVSAPAATQGAQELFTEPLQKAPEDPAAVLVTVNGKDITAGELGKELETMAGRMEGRVPPERMEQMRMQMRDQLLDNMITRQVLLDKVNEEKIEVSQQEFDEAVSQLTSNLPPGVALSDMLEQTGTTEEEFRETFGMELKVRKLIEGHTGGKPEATEEEIQTFYDENRQQFEKPESVTASHILISTDPADTEEAKQAKRKELEAIKEKLAAGADFAEMAKEHSSCPSKDQGGSLGSFPRGRMVPEFETAAFSQEIGQVGDIVETQFGYHLIKVDSRDEAGVTPLEDVKEQLGNYLSNQKQQTVAQEYVKELREKANITYPGGK